MNDYTTTNIEKHQTKDTDDGHINGELAVVWRDWDDIIKNYPKMVYVSSINPREIKGPHIHTKRTSHFVCIHGKVLFIVKNNDGTYSEIESSDEHPVLIHIPKNIASAHINLSTDTSRVLALADISWKPNDDEMINTIFDDYDWKKWI